MEKFLNFSRPVYELRNITMLTKMVSSRCLSVTVRCCALQVQLFIGRLAGPPIGFSVCSLFVIDKSSFLTVSISLLVDYNVTNVESDDIKVV